MEKRKEERLIPGWGRGEKQRDDSGEFVVAIVIFKSVGTWKQKRRLGKSLQCTKNKIPFQYFSQKAYTFAFLSFQVSHHLSFN